MEKSQLAEAEKAPTGHFGPTVMSEGRRDALGSKRSYTRLSERIKSAINTHYINCPGENMIPLGEDDTLIWDIDPSDADYPLWIQNGIVYILIECPKIPHESVANMLQSLFYMSLVSRLPINIVDIWGAADQLLINELGCHNLILKQPDGSFQIIRQHRGSQVYPIMIIEVASQHETKHILMCEMAAWFYQYSDVKFSVAAKLNWSKDPSIEIFQFRNNRPRVEADLKQVQIKALEKAYNDLKKEKRERCHKLETEAEEENEASEKKKYCLEDSSIDYSDPEELKRVYGLDLIGYASFKLSDFNPDAEIAFRFELGHLLKDTEISLLESDYTSGEIQLNLNLVLSAFFEKAREYVNQEKN